VPAQPVDATPSAINLFSKAGVYDATETGEAFRDQPRFSLVFPNRLGFAVVRSGQTINQRRHGIVREMIKESARPTPSTQDRSTG
jgi:hypothetical protein